MWMASKMEEITSPSVDDFVYISADSYSKREITEMEMGVCSALQFRLWHVTPLDFCEEFLRASANKRRIGCPVVERSLERSMVEYLLALSLLPYELVSVAPRKVAAAAVYLARVVLGMEQPWSPTLQHYSGFTMWDLEDTVLTIHRYHAAAEESKLSNAFHKFSKEKYHHVALKTVPLEQHLGF
jgi:cyclin A